MPKMFPRTKLFITKNYKESLNTNIKIIYVFSVVTATSI